MERDLPKCRSQGWENREKLNQALKSFETPASSPVLMKMHQQAGSEVTVIRQMHHCKQCLKDTCNYSCSGTMKYILFLK